VNKQGLLLIALFSTFMFTGAVGTQVVNLAKANPIREWRFDASPTITIQSPENNKTYTSNNANNVFLVFNLTKPTANLGGYPYKNNWYEPIKNSNHGDDFGNRVANATYYIDDQPSNVSIEVNSHLLEPFNYSLPLKGLADGNHSLQICLFNYGVEGWIWTAGGSLHYCNYYSYSEIVNFTVVSSDNMVFTAKPLSVNEMTIALIAVFVAIVCVGVGSLVYFKKRQRGKGP
jgi:hypothetical protein